MKLTEEQEQSNIISFAEEINEMKKEFEIITNTLNLERAVNTNQEEQIKALKNQVKDIQSDINLERPRYGATKTRDLAMQAYNQSTVKANWEGLGNHPVIKNVYESIMNRSTEEGRRADDILRKFGNMPSYHEIMKGIEEHSEIVNLWSRINDLGDSLGKLELNTDNDRSHNNGKILTIHDRFADIETGLEALEFLQSETGETMTSAFLFVIGAFATMKYANTAEGLRQILDYPKEQPKENGPPES